MKAVSGSKLHGFVVRQLQQAEKELTRQGRASHEGIHQARKCMRRARAALALAGPVLDGAAPALGTDIQQTCRALSALRDRQALVEAVDRLSIDAPPALGELLPGVHSAACRWRDAQMPAPPGNGALLQACRTRLRLVRKQIHRLSWPEVDSATLVASFRRSARRAAKTRRQLQRKPDSDKRWHAYRRKLRRLHQQRTILLELFALDLKLGKRQQLAASLLGEAQDYVLLLEHCRTRPLFDAPARSLIETCAGARLADIRKKVL
jgi:hypothetical protein